MSRQINFTFYTIIIMGILSSTVYSAPGDTLQVIDFDFSLSCADAPSLGNPQFPDKSVTNARVVGGVFTDGVYIEGVGLNQNTYVAFDFNTVPVYNYTAPNGIDNINHPAPSFDLVNLTADFSSFYANWNDIEFNQGNSDVPLIDNLDRTFTADYRSLISGAPFDGCTGRWKFVLDCTSCPPSQLGISPTLSAYQNGSITRTITTTGGNVTLSSTLGNSPSGFGFIWTTAENSITDLDSTLGTFTFDPVNLMPGKYIFTMTYNNNTTVDSNGNPAPTKGISRILLNVVTSTNGDMNDDNNNGITNANDSIRLTDSQLMTLPGNPDAYVLQTSKGVLKLGRTAFCAEKAARITAEDIENFGSDTCGIVSNSSDDIIKRVGIGGYFDFEIHDLAPGEQVQVVIPLDSVIPHNATYRKYIPASGWTIFDATGSDSIASSPGFSPGICPAPDSQSYTPGLIQGYSCVRLSITDGGPNDTDSSENGVIVDPGSISEIQSGVEAELGNGCSLSSHKSSINQHIEWLLLIIFISVLGVRKKAHTTT